MLQGNQHASFVARFALVLAELQIPFWIENPDRSWLWKQPCLAPLLLLSGVGFWRYDCCVFSKPWQKRTRVLTTTDLAGTENLCRAGHQHLVLRGRSKQHKQNWTKVAESYPPGVCSELAGAILRACWKPGPSVSNCVFGENKRIGEAENPGPRSQRAPRTGSLFDVELVERPTLMLRESLWEAFRKWLSEHLSERAIVGIFACPPLLSLVLRSYVDELYKTGFPLHNCRQLLAHAQRLVPMVKPHLHVAWDFISRWEELQPVEHRVPMPEIILRALLGLAITNGWLRWAATAAGIFFGISRPGEFLAASRKHLLTPENLLENEHMAVYLRIEKPKSRRRAARVQHVKVAHAGVVKFLQEVWQDLKPDERLYPGSSSVFRRRWDRLLQVLGIPKSARLTPASLRAGGAIAAFRAGAKIDELLWQMRLRSTSTLEFYLQEMAAVSVLPNLQPSVRRRIKVASVLAAKIFS